VKAARDPENIARWSKTVLKLSRAHYAVSHGGSMKSVHMVSVVAAVWIAACAHPGQPPSAAPAVAASAASVTSAAPPISVADSQSKPVASAAAAVVPPALEALPLPGASGPLALDYLFYEPVRSRVWVPAGGTGSVAVFDISKHSFTRIDGFQTAEREAHGRKRVLGPSSGSVGDGFAYVGDRASREVCAIDLQSLEKGPCLQLPAPPDGVQYIASTREVWVTAPEIKALLVLEALPAGQLKSKATITLPGEPEGYAVDAVRGHFLTNLEDAGKTLSIDLKTHRVLDTWNAQCGADGPRGIAIDSTNNLVIVACTDHVQALDGQSGAPLGRLETGAGLDNIDYEPNTHLLYAASGKAARLTVARVGDRGQLTETARLETTLGARNAVSGANGTAYVADPQNARLLVLHAP
jgi:DNA-binding beta-propeller fold protein YncE